jgi:AraC-like DNA-binding protein
MRGRQQPNQRTYTFAHRQHFAGAIDVYLRWCYRHQTAARTSELRRAWTSCPVPQLARPDDPRQALRVVMRAKQLKEAERLHRHTPLAIEEAAIRAAFGTPSTFYRWFVEKHGITPAAFLELKK